MEQNPSRNTDKKYSNKGPEPPEPGKQRKAKEQRSINPIQVTQTEES